MQPREDWSSKTKRLIFNIFLIILLLIAVAKVIREELKGLPWLGGLQIIFATQQMEYRLPPERLSCWQGISDSVELNILR